MASDPDDSPYEREAKEQEMIFELTPKQEQVNRMLAGEQRSSALVGGARSGKTFLITRAILIRGLRAPTSRHAFLRFRFNAVRASIWLDTLPKVMDICFPGLRGKCKDQRQDGYVELPNESQLWMGGLDEKERVEKILGQEYASIYFNESSQIPLASYLVARTRLAQVAEDAKGRRLRQREYVDLNPVGTTHWSFKQYIRKVDPESSRPLKDPENYSIMYLNPNDNIANLDPAYLASLAALPEKHRKRFYEGRFVTEVDGALWNIETIERNRRTLDEMPDLQRVAVSVDPSGAAGKEDKKSDDIGISVTGLGVDGQGYVLDDLTCKLGPSGWARRAVDAYNAYDADCIVAEANFGGEMVRSTIATIDAKVPVYLVHASRGKVVRAEPVSALYDKDLVHHVGSFPELEEQMGNFTASGYLGERSPDRTDALVWGITFLMLTNSNVTAVSAPMRSQ